MNKKHLLVIRFSAMGDVAMLSAVLYNLVRQNPDIKITMLSKAFLKPLFADIPNVTFFAADTQNKHKGLKGIYKLYQQLKILKIDAIADVHNVLRSRLLCLFFIGSKIKVCTLDKGRKEKKYLIKKGFKTLRFIKNTHQRYADVFKNLGVSVCLKKPAFVPKKSLSKSGISKDIASSKNKNQILLGLAPFAGYDSKTYPLNLMEQVVQYFSSLDTIKICLFGGNKKEIEILNLWEQKYANTLCIAGTMRFEKELCLIANLSVMLAMDSSNGHLSALFGIPTITVWGATHPATGFTPFAQPKENSILPDIKKYPWLPCSVYGNKVFKGYENVMESISPQELIQKVLKYIPKNL